MSLLTTRLGIKKPQDPDLFLTSDFDSNYDLIDSYPGVWVCTSSTLPSWGAAQNGQLVVCTDTRQLLEWNNTSGFRELLTAPAAWDVTGSVSASINSLTPATSTYTLGTFTSSRAGNAAVYGALNFQPSDSSILVAISYYITVNGTYSGPVGGKYATAARVYGTSGAVSPSGASAGSDPLSIPYYGLAPVAVGTNTVVLHLTCKSDDLGAWMASGGTHSPFPITFNDATALIHSVNTTSP